MTIFITLRSRFESHPRSGLLVYRSFQTRALRSADELLARCRNSGGAHGLCQTTLFRPLLLASSQNPAPRAGAFLLLSDCAEPADIFVNTTSACLVAVRSCA